MKKLLKRVWHISFIIYVFMLIFLLFFDGRHSYVWNDVSLFEYIQFSSNFVPFTTINLYINALMNGTMNIDIPIKNLFGNLFAFLPMGIYLPYYLKKTRKVGLFILTMFAILLTVEVVQVLTRVGSFDIDDLILNLVGAFIGFGIWKIYKTVSTSL